MSWFSESILLTIISASPIAVPAYFKNAVIHPLLTIQLDSSLLHRQITVYSDFRSRCIRAAYSCFRQIQRWWLSQSSFHWNRSPLSLRWRLDVKWCRIIFIFIGVGFDLCLWWPSHLGCDVEWAGCAVEWFSSQCVSTLSVISAFFCTFRDISYHSHDIHLFIYILSPEMFLSYRSCIDAL